MFASTAAMEPLLPAPDKGQLDELAITLIRESSDLGGRLHPVTRKSVRELLRSMNSYYSNLIEGHATNPVDIEKALKGDYSKEPAKRALQIESAAHVEVQRLVEARLESSAESDICSSDFLCWIHSELYARFPEEFRKVEDAHGGPEKSVIPGRLREGEVKVGAHVGPFAKNLPEFLNRFRDVYSAPMNDVKKVIAAAAAHHRLAWIHPFLDGNGRVTRLFTEAFLIRAKIGAQGLWSISRGLARRRDDYYAMLTCADASRRNDLDGRGNLSDSGLVKFCTYFLETCLDQVRFMSGLLELDDFQGRLQAYTERRAHMKEIKAEAVHLLRDAFLRGEVPRGEAPRITGLQERTARDVLGQLVSEGLLISDSPKTPVRLGFPAHTVGYYFPRLYPDSVELPLLR